jgi:hypothetical protein
MKFLCLRCDQPMSFAERQLPGDGTLTAVFSCPACAHEIAMLTNPMETQLVSSLGIEIGGRTVPAQPFQQTRAALDAPEGTPRVAWSEGAIGRLERVPKFVRGMVRRIYTEYAQERAITLITEEVMDRARSELGLEGM